MSQVIVEEDNLKAKREKSRELEKKIQIENVHQKWHQGGTQGLALIAKGAAIAFLPVVALWTAIGAIASGVFRIIGGFFRILGTFWPKQSRP